MSQDLAAREREVVAKHRGSGRMQSLLFVAPAAIVYAQQQIGYALVPWSCTRLPLLAHLPTITALLLLVLVAHASWRLLARAGVRAPGDERSSEGRARFMAAGSLVLCGFAAVVMLAQWLPVVILHPCQR